MSKKIIKKFFIKIKFYKKNGFNKNFAEKKQTIASKFKKT